MREPTHPKGRRHYVPPAVRRGRPRSEQAGEVDERILEAGTSIFLSQGFGRTTLEQVAALAMVGNTTLYKRYPGKESLFTACVHYFVEKAVQSLNSNVRGETPSSRLRQMGINIANSALTRDVMAIMRISAAEAESFPDVAREGYRVGVGASIRLAAQAIAGSEDETAIEAATGAATRFVELALHPLELQGMFGADLESLRRRVDGSVDDAINVLLSKKLIWR